MEEEEKEAMFESADAMDDTLTKLSLREKKKKELKEQQNKY